LPDTRDNVAALRPSILAPRPMQPTSDAAWKSQRSPACQGFLSTRASLAGCRRRRTTRSRAYADSIRKRSAYCNAHHPHPSESVAIATSRLELSLEIHIGAGRIWCGAHSIGRGQGGPPASLCGSQYPVFGSRQCLPVEIKRLAVVVIISQMDGA
jgi:hypothetical protein